MNDNQRPLVSTEVDMPETKKNNDGCSGCLGKILGTAFWIFVIAFIIHSCSGDKADKPNDVTSNPSQSVNVVENTNQTTGDTQSKEADIIEKMYFHEYYTELGTVDVHHFDERKDALDFIVQLGKDKSASQNWKHVSWAEPLFGDEYLYFPVNEETAKDTNLYYIGETKDERPHGFGGLFSFATGSGTYDFQGEILFQYVGNFKNGMLDGYGVVFAADESNLTQTVTDIIKIKDFSEDDGERLVQYLFNHVSYEGYLRKNQKHGKGNSFDFPLYEDSLEVRYAFHDSLNVPIDNYIFGPVYPHVTKGEYKKDVLSGKVKKYKYNHLVYDGKVDDKDYDIESVVYPDEKFKEYGELYYQNIWGLDILYDMNGFFGFYGESAIE